VTTGVPDAKPVTTPPHRASGFAAAATFSGDAGKELTRRPTSAPCGRPRSVHSQRAKDAVARRLDYEREFVEKSRAAWDQKMASIERHRHRQAISHRRESAVQKQEASEKAAALERCQHWMPLLGAAFALRSLSELLVSGRMLRLAARLREPEVSQVKQQLAWREESAKRAALRNSSKILPWVDGACGPASLIVLARAGRVLAQLRPELSHPTSPTSPAPRPTTPASGFVASPAGSIGSIRRGVLLNRSAQLALVRRMHAKAVVEHIVRAAEVGRFFPELREKAAAGFRPSEADWFWQEYQGEVQRVVEKWRGNLLRWRVVATCLRAVGIFARERKRKISGRLLSSFLLTLVIHKRLVVAWKHNMACVRRIQRAVRKWLRNESTKQRVMEELFSRCEARMLKKRWAEEDLALLERERRLLRRSRCLEEKKVHELLINLTLKNHEHYRRPKKPEDLAYIQQRLKEDRLPPFLIALSIQHVGAARNLLRDRILRERMRLDQQHERELQMWRDIEQAVKMIHPESGNPAPQPTPPKHQPLPPLKVCSVVQIIREVSEWYGTHKPTFQAEVSKMSPERREMRRSLKWWGELGCIDKAIRDIVHKVFLHQHLPEYERTA